MSLESVAQFKAAFPGLPGNPNCGGSSPNLPGAEGMTYSFTHKGGKLICLDTFPVVDDGSEQGKAYTVGDKQVLNEQKAHQLTEAVAWCRFIRRTVMTGEYREYGTATLRDFYRACADILAVRSLEGLRVKTPASLRKKMLQAPGDIDRLRHYLVSGKYGNDNPRKIGKYKMVDTSTGEILRFDEHEAIIMTYWLNPGSSTKDSKRSLWQQYASDMEVAGKTPLSQSTFNHYTNTWANKLLSSKERHGSKHSRNTYRPYVPAKPLEYANSLWASDGSGVVPYRYMDQHGKWRMMKLYVMLVSDTASRYIAGYSVSRVKQHKEDFTMLHSAMQMALRDNGRTEVLDFISDNHGEYYIPTTGHPELPHDRTGRVAGQPCRNDVPAL